MSDENGIMPKFGFRTSTDVVEIAAALVSAQGEFGAAIKDSANPAYRSKYADLSSCIEATQKALNKHGIALMQAPQLDGQMVTITTRLQHKSGQWYESDLTLPAVQRDRFDAQSVGSAITYGRRYSLQSILNLATADDDGNAASGVGSSEASQAVGKAKVSKLQEKAGKPPANGSGMVPTLFFTEPPSHNGFFAEWVNIKEFLGQREDIEDSLRMVFTAHRAKQTKSGTTLVPTGEMQALTEKLVGEMGITVRKLESNA